MRFQLDSVMSVRRQNAETRRKKESTYNCKAD